MSGFNNAMSSIESGMTSNAQVDSEAKSAAAAQSTANPAKTTAEEAKSVAGTAQSAANVAQSAASAAYSPSNLPFVIGSYIGDSGLQIIQLNWMLFFLIITGMRPSVSPDSNGAFDRYFAIVGGNGTITGSNLQQRVQLVSAGFIVFEYGNNCTYTPVLNEKDRKYHYIAFK